MEDELKQKRFLWGTALAWVPLVLMMAGMGYSFRGIPQSHATGLAVVAVGFAEAYVMIGLAATLICGVGALALLFRAFSRGHGVRSVFAALSICMSGPLILFFSLSVWMFWFESHQGFRR